MSTALLSTVYAGNIQYYSKLMAYDHLLLDGYQHYVKQTFRNRCQIASANGKMDLIIPVIKDNGNKTLDKDIRIADEPWQKLHWGALEAAYRHSPFFMYYEDDLAPFFHQKFDFLLDFNTQLQEKICELIDLHPSIQPSSSYMDKALLEKQEISDENDWRASFSPKKETVDAHFIATPYYQVFAQKWGFISNLSVFDLLFNMGNESILVLQKTVL